MLWHKLHNLNGLILYPGYCLNVRMKKTDLESITIMSEKKPLDKISINYLEFNVSNIARSQAFYQQLGWTFIDYGQSYCEFDSGALKGGFSLSHDVQAAGGALIILYSPDLEQSLKQVIHAEGVITQEIFNFPGGRRFHFLDPDGYQLAIWSDQ